MTQPIFHPQPHAKFELAIMRLLFALVVWDVIPWSLPREELTRPVGLAGMGLDLRFLAEPALLVSLNWFALALLVGYVAGLWPWLTTSLLCLLTVLVGTYVNSAGAIKHHHQIVSLILLTQAVWHIWYAVRHRGHQDFLVRERWGAFVSQQAIAATYVVTAITKLTTSGFAWIRAADNYPIQLRKSNQQAYYDTLEAATEAGSAMEKFIGAHPQMARAMLAGGLAVELFAFLALLGRRWSFIYGCLLLFFHALNSIFMNLNFRWHNEVIGIYLILPPIIALIQHWSEDRTRHQRHSVASPRPSRRR
jgi:hypothetical protein